VRRYDDDPTFEVLLNCFNQTTQNPTYRQSWKSARKHSPQRR
jgi:hypothetical protein